jgi:hypothetical protein
MPVEDPTAMAVEGAAPRSVVEQRGLDLAMLYIQLERSRFDADRRMWYAIAAGGDFEEPMRVFFEALHARAQRLMTMYTGAYLAEERIMLTRWILDGYVAADVVPEVPVEPVVPDVAEPGPGR